MKYLLNKTIFQFFAAGLLFVFTADANAQSGSLAGNSAVVLPSGRAVRMPETSLIYQPAPRQKVFQPEDIVLVHIKQDWAYRNNAINQRKKKIEAEGRITYFFKFPGLWQLPTKADTATLPEIGGEIDHKTQNQGTINRTETLDFKISCRVVSVQDNGNLHIEGTSQQQIGEEGKIMYVGGIIRPEDIGPNNMVPGERVVDLTVKEIPSGNVFDTYRRGWGTQLIERWKPF